MVLRYGSLQMGYNPFLCRATTSKNNYTTCRHQDLIDKINYINLALMFIYRSLDDIGANESQEAFML